MMLRKGLHLLAVLGIAVAALVFLQPETETACAAWTPTLSMTAPAATFDADGASLGAIPDHTGTCQTAPFNAGRNVTFNVSGLSGSVTNVEVSTTLGSPNHTWMGDITATLIAPNGASHVLFGRTGATTSTALGDSTNLGGTYVFNDVAVPPNGGWWQTSNLLTSDVTMTSASYRTTASGGAGATNPQPPTTMNTSFSGVTNANGTWTLKFIDGCTGDTGAVTAANLTLTTGSVVPAEANADFDGDGKTDFTVARGTATPGASELADAATTIRHGNYSGLDERPARADRNTNELVPQAPPIYWYTSFSNGGSTLIQQLGDAATDFITPEDFDGDGKDDLAVWTEAAATVANFKILRSSTNTVLVQTFGQTGDDPAVVGDYDGDGKADAAVFRCPAVTDPDGQCYFFYRGSLNNPGGNITYVPWGFGAEGDFFPYVGDFDGDGKNDFCIQRANPASPTNGQFVLKRSSDNGVEYINWGQSSDFLIPGDYDGDGKTDLCVRRTVSGSRIHFVLYRTGATSQTQWGITGDSSAPGDYDGDGKTDFAIWRGSATPGDSRFWILNSSNAAVVQKVWGQGGATPDFAVAGWAVH